MQMSTIQIYIYLWLKQQNRKHKEHNDVHLYECNEYRMHGVVWDFLPHIFPPEKNMKVPSDFKFNVVPFQIIPVGLVEPENV